MPVTPTLIPRAINTYIDAHGQTPTYTHAHKKESRNKNIKDTLKELAYLDPALSPSSKWPQRRIFYNCILTLIRFRIPFITRLCRNEQGAPALYPGTAGTHNECQRVLTNTAETGLLLAITKMSFFYCFCFLYIAVCLIIHFIYAYCFFRDFAFCGRGRLLRIMNLFFFSFSF